MSDELTGLLQRAIQRAESKGASAADAIGVDYVEGNVRVRLGEVETIQRARQRRLGLRVFFGKSQAITASGDLRPETLDRLVDDTCDMARVTAEDPFSGLPDAAACAAAHVQRPDLYDPAGEDFDLEAGADWARRAEAAAMDADPRIDNSEGGEFGFSSVLRTYAASGGIQGSYRSSSFSGYVVPVARHEGTMERDWWFTQRRKFGDLESPETIGRIAAERTLRRLGATQAKTCKVPVVWDARMASRLIGYLASAASGYAIYRGASYLRDRLGDRVASDAITLVDDGTLAGGMGTKPYDGEGIGTTRKALVHEGVLQSYLLDTYSARKLEMESTGNAARSVGDAPTVGATNLHLLPGEVEPSALLDGIKDGFYVTELIGFGVNTTTGDYSQGASGLWIRDGKLAEPVNEITIAGTLNDMLCNVDLVANDLDVH
ncbi:MAG: PmbA protein, partial [Myxococcota bacterium]